MAYEFQDCCEFTKIALRRNHEECLERLDPVELCNKLIKERQYQDLSVTLKRNEEYLDRSDIFSFFCVFTDNGLIEPLKYFIDNRLVTDINVKNMLSSMSDCPLKHPEVCELFINHDQTSCDPIVLINAASFGHESIVKLIVKLSLYTIDSINEAFAQACRGLEINVVEYLLTLPKVDPSYNNYRALLYAAESGSRSICDLLIKDPRVDVNCLNGKFLMKVCQSGEFALLKRAIEVYKCDPCLNDHMALMISIVKCHNEIFEYLLNRPEIILDLATHDNKFEKVISCGQNERRKEFIDKLVKEINWLKDELYK